MSIATRTVTTTNQSTRNGARPRYIVHHHMATTGFNGVLDMWHRASKEGSAHIAISNDGEIVEVVPEHLRAWSLSSESFDSQALVTEIANESLGGSWPVSSAAHEAAARVTADWCKAWNIPCNREHVIDHGEVYTRFGKSYATACAGGLDLDWIVNRANQLIGNPSEFASITPTTRPSLSATVGIPRTDTESDGITGPIFNARLQLWAQLYGGYTGPLDGVMGVNSWKGVQTNLVRESGYDGPVDGVPGPNTWKAVQRWASRYGYDGPVDGAPGPNTWRAVAKALNTL